MDEDKYDRAVDFLTENPETIEDAWGCPDETPEGCLFLWVMQDPSRWTEIIVGPDGRDYKYGCLTQIKGNPSEFTSDWPDITAEILRDERIPLNSDGISPDNLHVFAEWQRRIDKKREESL